MSRQTNKQNSFLLSGDGEWHTNEPVVVGKYTQNRQRWLRTKIVKPGHGRHYKKKALVVYRRLGPRNRNLKKREIENKYREKEKKEKR